MENKETQTKIEQPTIKVEQPIKEDNNPMVVELLKKIENLETTIKQNQSNPIEYKQVQELKLDNQTKTNENKEQERKEFFKTFFDGIKIIEKE